jgi:hypothetical protein
MDNPGRTTYTGQPLLLQPTDIFVYSPHDLEDTKWAIEHCGAKKSKPSGRMNRSYALSVRRYKDDNFTAMEALYAYADQLRGNSFYMPFRRNKPLLNGFTHEEMAAFCLVRLLPPCNIIFEEYFWRYMQELRIVATQTVEEYALDTWIEPVAFDMISTKITP